MKAELAMKVHCQILGLLRYNVRKIQVYNHPGDVGGDAFDLVDGWKSSLLVKIQKLEILILNYDTIMSVNF